VEVLGPGNIGLEAPELSGLLNDLLAGLHNLDMKVKTLHAEKLVLEQNAEALLKNLVLVSLHKSPADLKSLSGMVGVKELQLAPFLSRFLEQGIIAQDTSGRYKQR